MSPRYISIRPEASIKRDVQIHTDPSESANTAPLRNIEYHKQTNALYPSSSATMNSSTPPPLSKTPSGTIRSVPFEALTLETSRLTPDENSQRAPSTSDSPVSSSRPTLTSALTSSTNAQPPLTWQNNLPVTNGLVRSLSSEFGPRGNYTGTSTTSRATEEGSSNNNGTPPTDPSTSPWSSAVGRANLGKSGRVIERLMGENDMLKRELQIERLRSEESKQAVRMVEGRMEAMHTEFETKLHDAAINSTLLKRRERMLAEVKAQVDGEKLKAEKALEREQGWKAAMVEVEEKCKSQVDEANTYAALMEGRVNTLSSHWKKQEAEVESVVQKLGKEIEDIVLERREDDEKMGMLQDLCDQQAVQIEQLRKQNAAIKLTHEKYKVEKERGLKEIKANLKRQEHQSQMLLTDAKETLDKLKWALRLQENENEKLTEKLKSLSMG